MKRHSRRNSPRRRQRRSINDRTPCGVMFEGKNGKPQQTTLIEFLPNELRGPGQNRWGGSNCTVISPGKLWQRGRRNPPGRVLSEDERKAVEARLKAEGLL